MLSVRGQEKIRGMIQYYSLNEQGKRTYQEDSVGAFCQGEHGLFVVADGLGGHGHGDQASQCAVYYALQQYQPGCDPSVYFEEVFLGGNERLLQLQDERGVAGAAKTTLVCAMLENGQFFGAYIGDSRLYFFRQGQICYQTLDHSVPQMLVATGEIEPEQIRRHPDRNRLLRVLGDRERKIRYQEMPSQGLEQGDRILLCTDGFWDYVTERDMERGLRKAKNPCDWLTRMKRKVQRRGMFERLDNFSAIGIWVD